MVALVVHELAHVTHHGRCLEPGTVLRRQPMHGVQVAEKLQGMLADGVSLPGVDAVAFAGGQHALPALPFKLLVGGGFAVLFRQHLGQDAIAQTKLGVDKPGQGKALQQLGVDMGASDHDLAPFRPDAGNAAALVVGHPG